MDHAEVRELLELAAVEPGGIDAWLAQQSAEAAAVNQHLAACAGCAAERDALRGSAATIREVIRSTPSPELRARTLDLVAATGRGRAPEGVQPAPRGRFSLRSILPAAALGAVAAALVVGVVAWRTLDARLIAADARIAEQRNAIAGLTVVTDWTLRLGAAPDAQLVRLSSPQGGAAASGTVLLSADRGELVMLATDLPAPPTGYEYRCWVDQGSGPVRIGKMYQVGSVAYWGGAVERLRGIEAFTLGVTLASQASDGPGGATVLTGSQ
jgi:hypothetical protein